MTKCESQIERRTREIGREIFERITTARPHVFQNEWWDERILEWSMQDERIKTQLFRFIDVLPQLTDPIAVATHLKEYLGGESAILPSPLHWLINFVSPKSPPARLAAMTARRNALRLARRFVAGGTVAEALAVIRKLRRAKMGFTLDVLGEATLSEPEADRYQQRYLDLLDGLSSSVGDWPEVPQIDGEDGDSSPRVNLSVKLTALYSRFDPIDPRDTAEAVKSRLRPIMLRAREKGGFLNVDMEQYAFKDLTIAIFKEVLEEPDFRDWSNVGIVCQCYLRDSERDLEELIEWARRRGHRITIRLVKGAYWDQETITAGLKSWPPPVFDKKGETDANFERLAALLLKNHDYVSTAIASHNVRSIARSMALAEESGTPRERIEYQMLFGMGDPIKAAIVEMGRRLRVYTPYGELIPGMAYLIRRLLENTSNDSFLRHSFSEEWPIEELLAPPQQVCLPALHAEPRNRMRFEQEEPMLAFENEAVMDFSQAEARDRMAEALNDVRSRLGATYPLHLEGRTTETDNLDRSINPSRPDEVIGIVHQASAGHVEAAVRWAEEILPTWRETSAGRRIELIRKTAEIIRKRRFELSAWIVLETGKPSREADADVAEAIDFCKYYSLAAEQMSERPWRRNLPGEVNTRIYEPRGVAAIIAPWNFPLAILAGMASAALVTGNCAILKPAEQSAVVGAKLHEIFLEAGFPPEVVQLLQGAGEVVGHGLVIHPDVDLIAFTGSREVGLEINRQAAEPRADQNHIKKVVAEMGGKNAIIVDDDADLDDAVAGVCASAFGYSGQKCSACSRVIVLSRVYDAFCARIAGAAASLKVGHAEDPGVIVGPLIDQSAYEKVLKYVELGKREATLLLKTDVERLRVQGGYFVGPTIFSDVSPDADLAQEEIFGPVLAAIRVETFDDAIRTANSTPYALTGGVYSRSPGNVDIARRRFLVGNLYINRTITGAMVGRQPFGGFRLSGIGSQAGGPDYLLQYAVPRIFTENTLRHGFAPSETHDER
jgi:RHH-type proline utilization regulon transcriptional repressor/proline dehydrogenase/delta 1-pyrroline-5-carboxylate dehydrogenase